MNERIRQLRNDLHLSQAEFGAKINLSQNYIWMIEKGDRTPSDRTIADIAREFGVSLAWLEDGEGEMYVKRSANEELGLLVANIMSDADDSFRKRFITLLMALPPEDWGKIERFIDELQKSDSAKSTDLFATTAVPNGKAPASSAALRD